MLKAAPGGRVPPGFVVLARQLEELKDRIVSFAQVGMPFAPCGADTVLLGGQWARPGVWQPLKLVRVLLKTH